MVGGMCTCVCVYVCMCVCIHVCVCTVLRHIWIIFNYDIKIKNVDIEIDLGLW